MIVTVDELKSSMKEYTYDQLTERDDRVAERCIEKARTWAAAKTTRCPGIVFEESTDPVCHDIIVKRALYELYAHGEMEVVASDKKEDAWELLKAKYGSCVDETNQEKSDGGQRRSPNGKVVQWPTNKDSF